MWIDAPANQWGCWSVRRHHVHPGDECKILLHLIQEDTNARTTCICHHPLVLGDNNSTYRAILSFNGCISCQVQMQLSEKILWYPLFVWQSHDLLVRDMVHHHTNYVGYQRWVWPWCTQYTVRSDFTSAMQLDMPLGMSGSGLRLVDTSGVSPRKGLVLTSSPCENCLTMSHPLLPKQVKRASSSWQKPKSIASLGCSDISHHLSWICLFDCCVCLIRNLKATAVSA